MYLPCALADRDGPQTLHLTRHPECTSCLPPDQVALSRFPIRTNFEVLRTQQIEARSYASLVRSNEAPPVEFLKLDVQGFELRVLEGFEDYLATVVGIELESHFVPIYQGQPPFGELLAWLDGKGFELRRVEKQGPFEGAMIEINAWFSRRPDLLNQTERELLDLWEIVNAVGPRSLEDISAAQDASKRNDPTHSAVLRHVG